jgi:hypothetical protein
MIAKNDKIQIVCYFPITLEMNESNRNRHVLTSRLVSNTNHLPEFCIMSYVTT